MNKKKIGFSSLQFCCIAGLALLTFGCSDGGGYDPVTYATASGTVAQGKVKNAKVCADLNFNDRCDTGEPFTLTNATLTDFAGRYIIRNIPENTPYQFVTEGGVDSLTGLPALPMQALSEARNITPLTTLVAQSADPAAMSTLLDNLSGGQGYDIDISSASMPPDFLSLAKSMEKLLDTLAASGLSSAADQALVFNDIATVLLKPESANVPLGTIFQEAATLIAARTDFVDFKVAPGADASTFASAIGQMATDIETQVATLVDPVTGGVIENQTLQDLIDTTVTVAPLPVGGVSLYANTISVFNSVDQVVQPDGIVNIDLNKKFVGSLSVPATSFASAKVFVMGTNTFTTAKSYPNAAFTLTVSDTGSNRSLQVVVAGVNASVTTTGAVTLSGGTTLELRGVNSDGSVVVQKTLSSLGSLVTMSDNVIQFNLNLLKAEVESSVGSVSAIGSYSVSAVISGAPGVPASVGLTLN